MYETTQKFLKSVSLTMLILCSVVEDFPSFWYLLRELFLSTLRQTLIPYNFNSKQSANIEESFLKASTNQRCLHLPQELELSMFIERFMR
jgi:hypothetical protein